MRLLLTVGTIAVCLLGAWWFAHAQEVRSLWGPPTIVPPEEVMPAPTTPKKPAEPNPVPARGFPQVSPPRNANGKLLPRPAKSGPIYDVSGPTHGVAVEENAQAIQQTGGAIPLPKPPPLPEVSAPKPANLPALENNGTPAPAPAFPGSGSTPSLAPPNLPMLEMQPTPVAPPAPLASPAPANPTVILEPGPLPPPKAIQAGLPAPAPIILEPTAKPVPATKPASPLATPDVIPTPTPLFTQPAVIPEPAMKSPVIDTPSPLVRPKSKPSPAPLLAPPTVKPAPNSSPPTYKLTSPVVAQQPKPANDGPKAFERIRPTASPLTSPDGLRNKPFDPSPAPKPMTYPDVSGMEPKRPLSPPGALAHVQSPVVTVEKRGQAVHRAGETLEYQIIVRNLSTSAAQQVRIEDAIPTDATLVAGDPRPQQHGDRAVWVLPMLAGQAEQVLKLTLRAGTAGQFAHQTNVSLTAGSLTTVVTNASSVVLRPPALAESLTVRLLTPTSVAVGRPVVFDIQVTNRSQQPCNGLVLFGSLPEGLSHPQGQEIQGPFEGVLQPGATKTLRMPVTAVKPGRHSIKVRVATPGGFETTATAELDVTSDSLQVRQALGQRLFIGREADCLIELTNPTDQMMRNVTVANQLPEGVEYVASSDHGLYLANRRGVHWVINQLPAGRSHVLKLRLYATQAGQLPHLVTAKADGLAEARSQGVLAVEGIAGLTMKVIDRDNPLELGRETVYEIQVANPGTTPTTNVKLQVQFPPGLTPRSGDGSTRHHVDRQSIVFDPLPALGPQGQAIFRVSALGQAEGIQRVRFAIVSDQTQTPIIREHGTRVYRD